MAGIAPKNQGGVSYNPYYPGTPVATPTPTSAGTKAGKNAADYLAELTAYKGSGSGSGAASGSYAGNVSMPSSGAWMGGGATPARETGGFQAQPNERLAIPDTSAAQSAEFARAKDLAGLTARGALTGLAGAMAGRGTVGSGVEGRGQQAVINTGQQQLGEVGRQQAITGAELAQKQAEMAYQGGISQRGQDIGQQTAQAGYNVTQRGQDIASQSDAAQRALQASLTQYQGDINQQQFGANYGLSQRELELKREQGMLSALSGFDPTTLYDEGADALAAKAKPKLDPFGRPKVTLGGSY
jgi:hypothetical protein